MIHCGIVQGAFMGDVVEVLVDFFRLGIWNKGLVGQQKPKDTYISIIEHAKLLFGVMGNLFDSFLPSLCEIAADKSQAEEMRQKIL